MDTPKPVKNFLKACSAFVRGPAFLSIISVVLLAATIPAQATLLRGYIQQADSSSGQDYQSDSIAEGSGAELPKKIARQPVSKITAPRASAQTHHQNGAAEARPLTIAPIAMQPALAPIVRQPVPVPVPMPHYLPAQLQQAMLMDNSFPQTFAGAWKCITVVVDSAVGSIPIGQRVESAVNFVQTRDGRVVARWEQPGWTETQTNVVPVSANEANLERINYFREQGIQRGWAAHSRDRYLQLDANRIAASSQVEQFINGSFLGHYQTKSMLYRMSGDIAYAR